MDAVVPLSLSESLDLSGQRGPSPGGSPRSRMFPNLQWKVSFFSNSFFYWWSLVHCGRNGYGWEYVVWDKIGHWLKFCSGGGGPTSGFCCRHRVWRLPPSHPRHRVFWGPPHTFLKKISAPENMPKMCEKCFKNGYFSKILRSRAKNRQFYAVLGRFGPLLDPISSPFWHRNFSKCEGGPPHTPDIGFFESVRGAPLTPPTSGFFRLEKAQGPGRVPGNCDIAVAPAVRWHWCPRLVGVAGGSAQ